VRVFSSAFRARPPGDQAPRFTLQDVGLAAVLIAINLTIVWRLLKLQYSAHLESNEGSFIAIARVMARQFGDWGWWPYWNVGMPFHNVYMPVFHMVVALWIQLTGWTPAHSMHLVSGVALAFTPAALFVMARGMTGCPGYAFFAGLLYSLISFSAILFRDVRLDVGGWRNLRRLQVVIAYGEAPHIFELALFPFAILCLYLALTRRGPGWKIAAGVLAGLAVLSNAFGAVAMVMVAASLACAYDKYGFWRNAAVLAAVGASAYLWISPWLPPSLIHDIRTSSPTTEGDWRYNTRSWVGLAVLVGGFLLLWLVLRLVRAPESVRFVALFSFLTGAIVELNLRFDAHVLPQPQRYHLEFEMGMVLLVVFAVRALLDRLPVGASHTLAVVALILGGIQFMHVRQYARRTIISTEITQRVEYKIAKWMDENQKGQRAFISNSASFLYNVFTDNPQVFGGHEPSVPNMMTRVALFVIYTDMNAGSVPIGAEASVAWLKAFGARAISVSGPNSPQFYRPFVHPDKFEGVLPLLWREGDDRIYAVPARSSSLAHVIPASAVVSRIPIHGLDIDPLKPYLAALDDPDLPDANFKWDGSNKARISAQIRPGQLISVQINYTPGWEATIAGVRQEVRPDGIGLLVIQPNCSGNCEVQLAYTGGAETTVTRIASVLAMLIGLAYLGLAVRSGRRARLPGDQDLRRERP
jgi:hypothetical protein